MCYEAPMHLIRPLRNHVRHIWSMGTPGRAKIHMGYATWSVPLILLIFFMGHTWVTPWDTFETRRGIFYNVTNLFWRSKWPSMGKGLGFYLYKSPSFIKEKPTILSRRDETRDKFDSLHDIGMVEVANVSVK